MPIAQELSAKEHPTPTMTAQRHRGCTGTIGSAFLSSCFSFSYQLKKPLSKVII
jgi:hypothetical protein